MQYPSWGVLNCRELSVISFSSSCCDSQLHLPFANTSKPQSVTPGDSNYIVFPSSPRLSHIHTLKSTHSFPALQTHFFFVPFPLWINQSCTHLPELYCIWTPIKHAVFLLKTSGGPNWQIFPNYQPPLLLAPLHPIASNSILNVHF